MEKYPPYVADVDLQGENPPEFDDGYNQGEKSGAFYERLRWLPLWNAVRALESFTQLKDLRPPVNVDTTTGPAWVEAKRKLDDAVADLKKSGER